MKYRSEPILELRKELFYYLKEIDMQFQDIPKEVCDRAVEVVLNNYPAKETNAFYSYVNHWLTVHSRYRVTSRRVSRVGNKTLEVVEGYLTQLEEQRFYSVLGDY